MRRNAESYGKGRVLEAGGGQPLPTGGAAVSGERSGAGMHQNEGGVFAKPADGNVHELAVDEGGVVDLLGDFLCLAAAGLEFGKDRIACVGEKERVGGAGQAGSAKALSVVVFHGVKVDDGFGAVNERRPLLGTGACRHRASEGGRAIA